MTLICRARVECARVPLQHCHLPVHDQNCSAAVIVTTWVTHRPVEQRGPDEVSSARKNSTAHCNSAICQCMTTTVVQLYIHL